MKKTLRLLSNNLETFCFSVKNGPPTPPEGPQKNHFHQKRYSSCVMKCLRLENTCTSKMKVEKTTKSPF